jgi:hypothetical protein
MSAQNPVESGDVPEIVVFLLFRRFMRLLKHHGIEFRYDEAKREILIKGNIRYVGLYSCGIYFYQDDDKRIMFCRDKKWGADVYIFGNGETSYINLPKYVEISYHDGYMSIQYWTATEDE